MMYPFKQDTWYLGVRKKALALRKLACKLCVFLDFYLFLILSMGAIFNIILSFSRYLGLWLFISCGHDSNGQVIHQMQEFEASPINKEKTG